MSGLDATQRETLGGLADALIPGGEGMLSATEADVPGKWVDRVLGVRPDLAAELVRVLDGVAGRDARDEVRRLRADDASGFGTLTLVVSGGYFMHPRVRKSLGYEAAAPKLQPAFPDESDFYLADGLVEAVIGRGPIYRAVPDGAAGREAS